MSKRTKKDVQNSPEESRLGGWLWSKRGTVAEPWPTAEELLQDKGVQEILRRVNQETPRSDESEKK